MHTLARRVPHYCLRNESSGALLAERGTTKKYLSVDLYACSGNFIPSVFILRILSNSFYYWPDVNRSGEFLT